MNLFWFEMLVSFEKLCGFASIFFALDNFFVFRFEFLVKTKQVWSVIFTSKSLFERTIFWYKKTLFLQSYTTYSSYVIWISIYANFWEMCGPVSTGIHIDVETYQVHYCSQLFIYCFISFVQLSISSTVKNLFLLSFICHPPEET